MPGPGDDDDFFDVADDDEVVPDPPPWQDPHAAVPELLPEGDDPSTRPVAIPVLDERTFVEECCARLNAFLLMVPEDARQILGTFVEYHHELARLHRTEQVRKRLERELPPVDPEDDAAPGSTVAALFAGILQTRHGDGYCLRPVFVPDPTRPSGYRVEKFTVVDQEQVHDDKE